MKQINEATGMEEMQGPVVVRLGVGEFQRQVLEKLGSLEAKMDMIVGNGQPGRMTLAEDRLVELEKNDLRRTIYDRIVIAGITFAVTFVVSALIAWRPWLGVK